MNNIEVLEYKKSFLQDFHDELKNETLPNIRSNSKAYKEIIRLISELNLKVIDYEEKINTYFKTDDIAYSNFKIKTTTLRNIISAKNELSMDSVSGLLDFLLNNLHEIFIIDKLTEIKPLKLNTKMQNQFDKTDFYLSTQEEKKDVLVYKVDDVLIYNEKEFLNTEKFKKFKIENEVLYFSPNYTLQEVDDFKAIWAIESKY